MTSIGFLISKCGGEAGDFPSLKSFALLIRGEDAADDRSAGLPQLSPALPPLPPPPPELPPGGPPPGTTPLSPVSAVVAAKKLPSIDQPAAADLSPFAADTVEKPTTPDSPSSVPAGDSNTCSSNSSTLNELPVFPRSCRATDIEPVEMDTLQLSESSCETGAFGMGGGEDGQPPPAFETTVIYDSVTAVPDVQESYADTRSADRDTAQHVQEDSYDMQPELLAKESDPAQENHQRILLEIPPIRSGSDAPRQLSQVFGAENGVTGTASRRESKAGAPPLDSPQARRPSRAPRGSGSRCDTSTAVRHQSAGAQLYPRTIVSRRSSTPVHAGVTTTTAESGVRHDSTLDTYVTPTPPPHPGPSSGSCSSAGMRNGRECLPGGGRRAASSADNAAVSGRVQYRNRWVERLFQRQSTAVQGRLRPSMRNMMGARLDMDGEHANSRSDSESRVVYSAEREAVNGRSMNGYIPALRGSYGTHGVAGGPGSSTSERAAPAEGGRGLRGTIPAWTGEVPLNLRDNAPGDSTMLMYQQMYGDPTVSPTYRPPNPQPQRVRYRRPQRDVSPNQLMLWAALPQLRHHRDAEAARPMRNAVDLRGRPIGDADISGMFVQGFAIPVPPHMRQAFNRRVNRF